MKNILEINEVNKTYRNSTKALDNIKLNIKEGEIFSLLGPNGAGKSTLINSICGIVNFNSGTIKINGYDNVKEYRKARQMTGIVPQELYLESFETVWKNVNYSRGLFGKPKNHKYIEDLLKLLSLWEKKDSKIKELSGGMKRRVLIAKALSHEPKILFLDEPTASVDVELRKDMWEVVKRLKNKGVTIILTTHYIEEAEEIADRVGFINDGKIILVEEKKKLLAKLGNKKLVLKLSKQLKKVPSFLNNYSTKLNKLGKELEINLDNRKSQAIDILATIKKNKFNFLDFDIKKRSLESIFINFIKDNKK